MGAGLLAALEEVVGPTHVLTGELTRANTVDWTGRWQGSCAAVVRPGSTEEVVGVVRACADAGAAIVPQGGNTGLVGGGVPSGQSVVVSSLRLADLGPVDDLAGQVTVGAGVTLASLAAAARRAGWRYPIDFAARESATVGGMIATNAGGHHVMRHGMTRHHVTGIEAVLADGSRLSHLGGLVKDNTGYDLQGLLCGSEGTLAIVTAARLALIPIEPASAVALVGFVDIDSAVAAVPSLRRSRATVEAIELMTADGLAAVSHHLGMALPIEASEAILLIEAVADGDPSSDLAEAVGDLAGVTDSAIGVDPVSAGRLWRWRDAHTEAISAVGPHPPHKLDVTVPLPNLGAFVAEVRSVIDALDPSAHVWLFGHAADGNLHVNITGPHPEDERLDEAVLHLVASFEGSISAEHGIGRAKRQWLHLSRSTEEIAAYRSIKAALDPAGLLNPGVLLPDLGDQGSS